MPIETGQIHQLGHSCESDLSSRLLAGIARSAEDLTNGRGWPDGVHGLLETLGNITGVSRVWIFQTIELRDTHIIQDYVFEWAAEPKYVQLGMQAFKLFRTAFDNDDYRSLVASRRRGEWQKTITSRLEDSPLRDSQVRQDIKSMLTIPIMVDDEWWGTLGFDDCEREYDWTEAEVALLRTATFLISNAVIKDRLAAMSKQFDILQSITESSAWEYNIKKGRFWCTADLVHSVPGASRNASLSLRGALKHVHHEDRAGLIHDLRHFVTDGSGTFRKDLRLYTQCGGVDWVEVIGILGRDTEGRPEQMAGIAVDIRNRKQREALLELQATTDHLTGAMNRTVFEQRFQEILDKARANREPFSLLLLDIDYFKQVNDTWGHDVGDTVLRKFVTVCGSSLRGTDLLARVGGEEFAILLPQASERTATTIGERIRDAVERSVFEVGTGGIAVAITTSVGCASYDGTKPTNVERMYHEADRALYAAKRQGRNRMVAVPVDSLEGSGASATKN